MGAALKYWTDFANWYRYCTSILLYISLKLTDIFCKNKGISTKVIAYESLRTWKVMVPLRHIFRRDLTYDDIEGPIYAKGVWFIYSEPKKTCTEIFFLINSLCKYVNLMYFRYFVRNVENAKLIAKIILNPYSKWSFCE